MIRSVSVKHERKVTRPVLTSFEGLNTGAALRVRGMGNCAHAKLMGESVGYKYSRMSSGLQLPVG